MFDEPRCTPDRRVILDIELIKPTKYAG